MRRNTVIFFCLWTILAIVQAYNMDLMDDEAYYWVCSENLDWGSFHTPPLIPFLIKVGYFIFPNEFGVRLLFLAIHIFTLLLIHRLLQPTNEKLFIIIISSFLVMHIGGILAVPDVPFLFFATLLIYFFTAYHKKDSVVNSLAIAVCMALIMYSKYHGVLVILALLAANISLFKRPSIYVIGALALILYIPHLLWLQQHDWISVSFHLSQREQTGYHWHYPFLFLGGLLLITGPFMGLLLIIPSLKIQQKSQVIKNLKYVLIVILLFFFILSFRNRIEANWMVMAMVPLIILGYKAAENNSKLKRWIYILFPITIILALAIRLVITIDILPTHKKIFSKIKEIHNNRKWVNEIEKQSNGRAVIFQGAHQNISQYLFYSKNKKASTIVPVAAHPSEFILLNLEKKYQGLPAYVEQYLYNDDCDVIKTSRRDFYFKKVEAFCSFAHAKIKFKIKGDKFQPSSKIIVPIEIENFNELDLTCSEAAKSYLSYFIMKNNQFEAAERIIKITDLIKSNGQYNLVVILPDHEGKFAFRVGIWSEDIVGSYSSELKFFETENK